MAQRRLTKEGHVRVTRRIKGIAFDLFVHATVLFSPGYGPKPCMDHDHPDFSDPGCPPEIENYKINLVDDVCVEVKNWNPSLLTKDEKQLLELVKTYSSDPSNIYDYLAELLYVKLTNGPCGFYRILLNAEETDDLLNQCLEDDDA